MPFRAQKIDSGTISSILRARREDLGLSIKEAGIKLRIKTRYLEDLEEERFGDLPAKIYAQSYLRKYAELLGLDSRDLEMRLEEEFAIEEAIKRRRGGAPKTLGSSYHNHVSTFSITPNYYKWFFGVLGVVVLAAFFFYQFNFIVRSPELVIQSPHGEEVAIDTPVVELRGTTSRGAHLTVNGRDVYVDKEGNFTLALTLEREVTEVVIIAKSPFAKTSQKTIRLVRK